MINYKPKDASGKRQDDTESERFDKSPVTKFPLKSKVEILFVLSPSFHLLCCCAPCALGSAFITTNETGLFFKKLLETSEASGVQNTILVGDSVKSQIKHDY